MTAREVKLINDLLKQNMEHQKQVYQQINTLAVAMDRLTHVVEMIYSRMDGHPLPKHDELDSDGMIVTKVQRR